MQKPCFSKMSCVGLNDFARAIDAGCLSGVAKAQSGLEPFFEWADESEVSMQILRPSKASAMHFPPIMVAVLSFGLISTCMASPPLTASALHKACTDRTRSDATKCDTYIRGFLDGISSGQAIERRKAPQFCPPKDGIDTTTGRKIIESHFRRHPDQMADEAGLSAMLAILLAFPCKPSTPASDKP